MAHHRDKGHKNVVTIIEKKLVPASIFHELENKNFYLKDHSLDQIKKWKTIAEERGKYIESKEDPETTDSTAPKILHHSTTATAHSVEGKAESLRGEGTQGISLEPRERLIANEGLRDPLSQSETYIVSNPADNDTTEKEETTGSCSTGLSQPAHHGSAFVNSHTTGSPKIASVAHPHSNNYIPKVRKNFEERANKLLKCLEGHGNLISWNDYGRISVGGNQLDTTWSEVFPALFSKNAPIHKDTNKILEVICHLKCEDLISNPTLCQNQKFSWFYLDY